MKDALIKMDENDYQITPSSTLCTLLLFDIKH